MKGLLAFSLVLLGVVALSSGQRRTWSSRRRTTWSWRRSGREAPVVKGYWGEEGAGSGCSWTGCVSKRSAAFCPAGLRETQQKGCANPSEIDVKCCQGGGNGGDNGGGNGGGNGAYPGVPAVPEVPAYGGGGKVSHNPTKGYWDAVSRCNWTGCAPRGSPAYCGAGQRESGSKDCDDPGRIDVKCC